MLHPRIAPGMVEKIGCELDCHEGLAGTSRSFQFDTQRSLGVLVCSCSEQSSECCVLLGGQLRDFLLRSVDIFDCITIRLVLLAKISKPDICKR
jgi:hypothetical protein